MRLRLQMVDGILNKRISQKRTERGKEISGLTNEVSLLLALLSMVDLIENECRTCFKKKKKNVSFYSMKLM
jgi:hypothetical protein